ncbi:hypothetical protein PFISCL1PPCAC_11697, partial [Pristionchus fissidentatus]
KSQVLRLFVGVFNLFQHRKNPMITLENLTDLEGKIILKHFTNAIVNMDLDRDLEIRGYNRPGRFYIDMGYLRQFISGMAITRIELLPMFLEFIGKEIPTIHPVNTARVIYRQEMHWKRIVTDLIEREEHFESDEEVD